VAATLQHRWDLSPKEAVAIQRQLADRVLAIPLTHRVRLVAGTDASYDAKSDAIIAGVVVWDLDSKRVIESSHVVRRCDFPYIPGLLSFREAPAVMDAVALLTSTPDVFMIDGQGLAHPRRFGLACHVGVLLDRPTIGCAKSRLCGDYAEPAVRRGGSRRLTHNRDIIGRVVRTRDGVSPLFISVGHRILLKEAERLVLRCCGKYRLPEPTRLAHQYVTTTKRQLDLS